MKKTALCLMVVALFVFIGCTVSVAREMEPMAVITLNGVSAAAEGEGVTITGSTVTVTAGGSYTLTGTLSGGTIVVDAGKNETVELILSGASITSLKGAAIYAKQAGETVVTLADSTENSVNSAYAGETDAALYAKDDLTIRGAGALSVYGSDQNGITSKDNLVIEGGTITIEAANHGLRGKDSVSVLGGTVTIFASGDGIHADSADAGTVYIRDGIVHITASHDGIQAEHALTVTGGEISILAGNGYTGAGFYAEESRKALKSADTVLIAGGTLSLVSPDDAIHAAKSVTVSGGLLTLSTLDDAIHADDTLSVSGGTIDILTCYEGLEGAVVSISGGTVTMRCEDDGINAVETAQSGQNGRMDQNLQVNITGGVITVNTYGDGIDSNGTVTMTGGQLYISGPESSRYGALDYDNSFVISGGVLAAAGPVRMAQTPGQSSAQPSVIVYFNQTQSTGNTYLLTDLGSAVLLSFTPENAFQCIVLSAPELLPGGSYAVWESPDGTLENAALLYEFTVSDIITSVGGTGEQTNP